MNHEELMRQFYCGPGARALGMLGALADMDEMPKWLRDQAKSIVDESKKLEKSRDDTGNQ